MFKKMFNSNNEQREESSFQKESEFLTSSLTLELSDKQMMEAHTEL
jgi:hypothetical protein